MTDQTWRVTNTRESSRLSTGGGFEDTLIVSFQTDNGVNGTVEVPRRLATADYVRSEIDKYVDRLDGIANL